MQLRFHYPKEENARSIAISFQEPSVHRWVVTMQLREATLPAPLTFHLTIEDPSSPFLGESESPFSCEMSVRFEHDAQQYRYCSGGWYKGEHRLPAELVERYHPLAALSTTIVDTTVVRVRSLASLEQALSTAFVDPDDVEWLRSR